MGTYPPITCLGGPFPCPLLRHHRVLSLGLPYNMPAHSLQRSQYVNGLAELPPSIRKALFAANAGIVSNHYHRKTNDMVPWFPYNFHAGNFYDPARDYSPQDQTTAELVQAGCTPLPVWVFSGRFTLEDLEKWTHRQITLFEKNDRTLHQVNAFTQRASSRVEYRGAGISEVALSICVARVPKNQRQPHVRGRLMRHKKIWRCRREFWGCSQIYSQRNFILGTHTLPANFMCSWCCICVSQQPKGVPAARMYTWHKSVCHSLSDFSSFVQKEGIFLFAQLLQLHVYGCTRLITPAVHGGSQ